MRRTKDQNLEMMQLVAKALGRLKGEVVFVGGATIGLYLTDPAAPQPRPSDDVDCIVEVASRTKYYELEDKLRKLRFQHKVGPDQPVCRWTVNGVNVDVMPIEPAILGFKNRWYPDGFKTAITAKLPNGTDISIFSLPYLVASKIEAFLGRGKNDFVYSTDVEDIVTLAGGCSYFHSQIAESPAKVRSAIAKHLKKFLSQEVFREAVSGHLGSSLESPQRLGQVLQTFEQVSRLS